jgi:hypothetical protein
MCFIVKPAVRVSTACSVCDLPMFRRAVVGRGLAERGSGSEM